MRTCPKCGYEGDDAAAGVCPRCDHDFTFGLEPRPGRRFATIDNTGPEVTLTLDPREPPLDERPFRCTRCGLETNTAPCRRCGGPGLTVFTPAERAVVELFDRIRVAAAERRELRERREAWQSFAYVLLVGTIGTVFGAQLLVKLGQRQPAPPAAQAQAEPEASRPPANDGTGGHKLAGMGLDAGPVRNSWPATWGENVGECRIIGIDEGTFTAVAGGPAVGAIHANNARAK